MFKIFSLLFFLFLVACTHQYTNKNNLDIEDIEKMYLNVESFEINKDNLDITQQKLITE